KKLSANESLPLKKAVEGSEKKINDVPKKRNSAKKEAAVKNKKNVPEKPAVKKVSSKKGNVIKSAEEGNVKAGKTPKEKTKPKTGRSRRTKTIKIVFQLKFRTRPGENLFITGDHEVFGENDINKALPLQYLNEEMWVASFDIDVSSI